MVYRPRPAPFPAQLDPRARLVLMVAVQTRSPFKALPKNIVERRAQEVDSARRRDATSFDAAAGSGGGGGGGPGGGGGGWPDPP